MRWDEDGTPRSTLFDDVYRSQSAYGHGDRGLAQSRGVFLQGCGLLPQGEAPSAWAGQAQWHVLETGFGLGLNFLATWQAWQQDPQRPERLFFTSIEAWPVSAGDIARSAKAFAELQPREVIEDAAAALGGEQLLWPSVPAGDPTLLYPDLSPDRFGAHLLRAWSAARAEAVFAPWYAASAASAVPIDPAALEPAAIARRTRARLRAGAAARAWHEALVQRHVHRHGEYP